LGCKKEEEEGEEVGVGKGEGNGNMKGGDCKKKERVVRGERRQKGNSKRKGVRLYTDGRQNVGGGSGGIGRGEGGRAAGKARMEDEEKGGERRQKGNSKGKLLHIYCIGRQNVGRGRGCCEGRKINKEWGLNEGEKYGVLPEERGGGRRALGRRKKKGGRGGRKGGGVSKTRCSKTGWQERGGDAGEDRAGGEEEEWEGGSDTGSAGEECEELGKKKIGKRRRKRERAVSAGMCNISSLNL
jgi:hypothetical protein